MFCLFWFVFVFWFFVFGDRVSQHSLGWLGSHHIDQAGLQFRNPSASASQTLGLVETVKGLVGIVSCKCDFKHPVYLASAPRRDLFHEQVTHAIPRFGSEKSGHSSPLPSRAVELASEPGLTWALGWEVPCEAQSGGGGEDTMNSICFPSCPDRLNWYCAELGGESSGCIRFYSQWEMKGRT